MVQLKEILRSHDLATTSTKADLLQHIEEADPTGEWMEAVRTEEPMRETEENDGIQRELELMRREKDLLERELQLTT